MKVTLPETAVEVLKEILSESSDKPSNIRVYFAGFGCGGATFGVALDDKKDTDLEYTTDDLVFIMDKDDYKEYGDITITDTGFGFVITVENMPEGECSCSGNCPGCN